MIMSGDHLKFGARIFIVPSESVVSTAKVCYQVRVCLFVCSFVINQTTKRAQQQSDNRDGMLVLAQSAD